MSSKGGSAALVWQLLPQFKFCAALPWFKPAQPWFNPLPWSGTDLLDHDAIIFELQCERSEGNDRSNRKVVWNIYDDRANLPRP